MMNVLRSEYVNPQAAMRQNSQMNPADVNMAEGNEKKQRTLEEERRQRGLRRKYRIAGKEA